MRVSDERLVECIRTEVSNWTNELLSMMRDLRDERRARQAAEAERDDLRAQVAVLVEALSNLVDRVNGTACTISCYESKCGEIVTAIDTLATLPEAARAEVERVKAMEAALGFYANKRTYEPTLVGVYEPGGACVGQEDAVDILDDSGQRAREALRGVK